MEFRAINSRIKSFQEFVLYEMRTEDINKLPEIKSWEDVKYYENTAMEKIRMAINYIVAKHPVYSLPILEFGVHLHWHLPSKTAATDYSNIYFDPKFALQLTNEELRFVLLHECLHVIYSHNTRLKNRDRIKWNCAADYAINDLLVLDPLSKINMIAMPTMDGEIFGLHDTKYRGLSAEQIYDIMPNNDQRQQNDNTKSGGQGNSQNGQDNQDNQDGNRDNQDGDQDNQTRQNDQETQDNQDNQSGHGSQTAQSGQDIDPELQHIIDSQNQQISDIDLTPDDINPSDAKNIKRGVYEKGQEPSEESMKKLKNEMREKVQSNGSFLGESLQKYLLNLMTEKSTIDWKQKLKKYIRGLFKNRNYVDSKRIYRPHKLNVQGYEKSRTKTVIKNLIIAIDISASINLDQIKKFINEINNILSIYIVKQTTIYYVDTEIKDRNIDTFGRHGRPDYSKVIEGGGTNFHPPFLRMQQDGIIPDIFIYFTDGESNFPSINYADIKKYKNNIFWCVVNDKNYFDRLEPEFGNLIHINYDSL